MKHLVNRDRLKQTHEKCFFLSDKQQNCRGRLNPISEQVTARKTYQWSDSWKKQRSLILILVFFFRRKLFCGDAIYCWWMWWLLQFNIPDMFLVSCRSLSLTVSFFLSSMNVSQNKNHNDFCSSIFNHFLCCMFRCCFFHLFLPSI